MISIIMSDAMLDLGSLQLFKAVAETGSVSRAAERLNCVQSNVTARLKGLERELGVALFERLSRGMALTPAGRLLDGYADRILALVGETRRAVRAQAGGTLLLGALETTTAMRLPAVLARFRKSHPAVSVNIETGTTEHLIQAVADRRVDCALVAGAVDHPDIVGELAFEEELMLVEPKAPRPAGVEPVLLIFRKGCSYRARAEQYLRESGRLPYQIMEFGTLDGIIGCVGAELGFTMLPRVVVDRPAYRATLRLTALPRRLARVPTMLIRRRDQQGAEVVDRFRAALRASA